MIKIKVMNGIISVLGHAEYDDIGKDIVCSAVSSIVLCSVEAIALFDQNAVDVKEYQDRLDIIINKNDDITNKLVKNIFAKGLKFAYRCAIIITRANIFNNIRPVFTALLMLLIFNEQLPFWKWIGIVIIIVGLFISQNQRKI